MSRFFLALTFALRFSADVSLSPWGLTVTVTLLTGLRREMTR